MHYENSHLVNRQVPATGIVEGMIQLIGSNANTVFSQAASSIQ